MPSDTSPGRPAPPLESIRARTVAVYLFVAAMVLLPGVLVRLGYDGLVTGLKPWFDTLGAHLLDIRFGFGLRFWLGIAGLSMMVFLLFYPLRKWLGSRGRVGRVGGWFHLHLVLGIAGPVAIAYHTNFGLGGTHANIALWTMVVVAGSGIVGQFVYASASADFYRGRLRAREQVLAIIDLLNNLNAMQPSRTKLIEDIEAFEGDLLTPRQGVFASTRALWRMESRRRKLARELGWHLGECARQLNLDEATHEALRQTMARQLAAFSSLARRGAIRSVSEQLLARWRLLHLPVFIIMLVAAALHIRNVWDMDAIFMTKVPTAAVRPPRQVAAPKEIIRTPAPRPAVGAPPPAPQPVQRNAAAATDVAGAEAKSLPKAALPAPQSTPVPDRSAIAAQPPSPPSSSSRATAPLDTSPRTAPNSADRPRTLAEQIATFKALKEAGRFAHALAETGFALTGKHIKLDCANCHTKPLQDAPQPKARACVDCHKEDDVHRGRRPNCAQCHTPNGWADIVRRR